MLTSMLYLTLTKHCDRASHHNAAVYIHIYIYIVYFAWDETAGHSNTAYRPESHWYTLTYVLRER